MHGSLRSENLHHAQKPAQRKTVTIHKSPRSAKPHSEKYRR
jgi:hypothetical protein